MSIPLCASDLDGKGTLRLPTSNPTPPRPDNGQPPSLADRVRSAPEREGDRVRASRNGIEPPASRDTTFSGASAELDGQFGENAA